MKLELTVDGMSCGHCVGRVTKAVQETDAAARVEIDLATRRVLVDSSAPPASIVAAIDAAGYPVVASTQA